LASAPFAIQIDASQFHRKSKRFQAATAKMPTDIRNPLVQAMREYQKNLFVWWRTRPTINTSRAWMGNFWPGYPSGRYTQRSNSSGPDVRGLSKRVPYWAGAGVKRTRPKGARYKASDKQLNIATSNGMLYEYARKPPIVAPDGKSVELQSRKPYAARQAKDRPWHWSESIAKKVATIVKRDLAKYVRDAWERA